MHGKQFSIPLYSSLSPQLARALTLRTLGWMSGVVGENRRVQHLIREALDAKEFVELQAAIMAAEKYAAKSKLVCEIDSPIPSLDTS